MELPRGVVAPRPDQGGVAGEGDGEAEVVDGAINGGAVGGGQLGLVVQTPPERVNT